MKIKKEHALRIAEIVRQIQAREEATSEDVGRAIGRSGTGVRAWTHREGLDYAGMHEHMARDLLKYVVLHGRGTEVNAAREVLGEAGLDLPPLNALIRRVFSGQGAEAPDPSDPAEEARHLTPEEPAEEPTAIRSPNGTPEWAKCLIEAEERVDALARYVEKVTQRLEEVAQRHQSGSRPSRTLYREYLERCEDEFGVGAVEAGCAFDAMADTLEKRGYKKLLDNLNDALASEAT